MTINMMSKVKISRPKNVKYLLLLIEGVLASIDIIFHRLQMEADMSAHAIHQGALTYLLAQGTTLVCG